MSHEIRTPINTIIGLNEIILREDISDEVAENARNIQGASKKERAGFIGDVDDLHLSGLNLGDVQNVVDEGQQHLTGRKTSLTSSTLSGGWTRKRTAISRVPAWD